MAKAKILIVEDEVIVSRDIKRVLQSLGYNVVATCISGEEALKEVKKSKPDLVLMDIILKGKMNGIEAARKIKQNFDLPVIFLTAYSNITYINRAKATEPFGYILKPIDERTLHIPIELALAKHTRFQKEGEKVGEALRESQIRYKQLVENINEGILMQDNKGKITYANEKFMHMIECSAEDILDHSIQDCLGDRLVQYNHDNKRNANNRWHPYETTWKQKDGSIRYITLSPKPIRDQRGRVKGTVAVATDITERRNMEMELKRSEEELRRLSQYIQSVRERESKRIAREIHDELGQKLTALKMDLSWLSQRIVLSDVGQKRYSDKVSDMSSLIDKTIKTVQKICSELRPGLLDDLGLFPAIEWLTQDFQARTNITCRIDIENEEIEINPEVSTAIFRISQEALTNVVRHSKASSACLTIRETNGYLELVVEDNGIGIKQKDILATKSLGLVGMSERLWPFKGEFEIKGVPKKGTMLRVKIPMEMVR